MVDVKLSKKISNAILVEGFPGFGLVGTITTEFLIEHLKCEKIATYCFEDLPPTIAVHENKIIDPIGVFYNKEYNLVVLHSISGAQDIEWKACELVLNIARKIGAKEIISIEGVGSPGSNESRAFYFTTKEHNKERLKEAGLKPLQEGIIMGVTSALMLKCTKPLTCIFAETESKLPDSKAAAKIIEVLDKYLDLKIDPKPLLETAERFEQKLKGILEQGKMAQEEKDKKQMSYVG